MSLLMDALRKAEQQKQALGEQPAQPQEAAAPAPATAAPTSGELALEPLHKPPAAGGHLPELPSRLEDLDDQFMMPVASAKAKPAAAAQTTAPAPATTAPAKPAHEPTRPAASQESARQIFAAKQPAQKAGNEFALVIGVLTLLAVVGIGGYFWWQLQPKGGLVASGAALPLSPAAARPAPTVAPSPVAVAPTPQPAPATAAPAPAKPAASPAKRTTPPRRSPAADPAAATPAQSPIRVTTHAEPPADPALERAWQAFGRGELDAARSLWLQALAADPRNADALHGLATIAQRRGQAEEAAGYHLRALEADPKDALALSGLLSLKLPADAQQTESRLKTLLAEQPDSPHLNFALGNLYARGARWAEAQQAFFKAHLVAPENADYLFNLAVSLDQLHQSRLAVKYYNQALAAAARQPTGFDAAQVAMRVKALQADQ